MQILGSKELVAQVQEQDLCVSCGACVGLCPYFKAHKGKIAMIFPCDLAQGRCYAHCPKTGVDYEAISQKLQGQAFNGQALGSYRKIAVSKAGEKIAAENFQNGGTVSALVMLALNHGLIDAAVLTGSKNNVPVPRLVTKTDEVMQCASTKYMATPTVAALNQGTKEGYTKMGMVGTACQITAVAKMKLNPVKKADFKDTVALTIGLFCTWALDTRKFINFLADKIEYTKIRGMDVPPPPAEIFVIKTDEGDLKIPLNEIRPLVPKGCSICPDMTAEWADISVGAFEGKPNWNTLIIRSQQGEQLVATAEKEGYLILDDFPQSSLEHLTIGAGNKKKRAEDNISQEAK